MKYKLRCSLIVSLLFCGWLSAFGSTWYVRPDGGSRYSERVKEGQCDGTTDAAYPGKGTNQHCAFRDVRYFWQDAAYTIGNAFPGWGWVGSGGDTYLIRGSIADKVSYRVGWNGPSPSCADNLCFGIAGDPYGSGAPPPPSGTEGHPTRILGENYASCHVPSARTQLHGGFGTFAILNMTQSSHVEIACLDLTDFSSCGRSGQKNGCNSNVGTLSDYATNGVQWSNKATYDTMTDVSIHGMASAGMIGPTGTGTVFRYLDLVGNASSGWNADSNNGTSGTGSLLVEHFNISWNGCAEQYPMVSKLPFGDCTDDNVGGYGDGFGTATVASKPGWQVVFDTGTVFNNTQDGLDALHIEGPGSSMTVTHTLVYGNMGQQIKIGGSTGKVTDNRIVANCNALRQDIPGTPPGYNKHLSDFCRAADSGIAIEVNNLSPLRFERNTLYSANATAIELECGIPPCGAAAKIIFAHNITIGFLNDPAHGYTGGGQGENPNPIYNGTDTHPFSNAGSVYADNVTFHPSSSWHCPAKGEQRAICGDPQLVDESWHNYGYGDMDRIPGSHPSVAALDGNDSTWEAPSAGHSSVRSLIKGVGLLTIGLLFAGGLFLKLRTGLA